MAIVYGLRPRDSDQYFYVGCTAKSADARLKQHIDAIRLNNNSNRHFVRKAKKVGLDNIAVDVLEQVPDGQQFECEIRWIKEFVQSGVKLTNLVHNGIEPGGWQQAASPYSLRNNWEWAQGWYADYQSGIRYRSHDADEDARMQKAQQALADVIARILDAPIDARQALIEQIE